MKLFDRVRMKSSGLTGYIVDVGSIDGKAFFIVELDDKTQDEVLPYATPDEVEPISEETA